MLCIQITTHLNPDSKHVKHLSANTDTYDSNKKHICLLTIATDCTCMTQCKAMKACVTLGMLNKSVSDRHKSIRPCDKLKLKRQLLQSQKTFCRGNVPSTRQWNQHNSADQHISTVP